MLHSVEPQMAWDTPKLGTLSTRLQYYQTSLIRCAGHSSLANQLRIKCENIHVYRNLMRVTKFKNDTTALEGRLVHWAQYQWSMVLRAVSHHPPHGFTHVLCHAVSGIFARNIFVPGGIQMCEKLSRIKDSSAMHDAWYKENSRVNVVQSVVPSDRVCGPEDFGPVLACCYGSSMEWYKEKATRIDV